MKGRLKVLLILAAVALPVFGAVQAAWKGRVSRPPQGPVPVVASAFPVAPEKETLAQADAAAAARLQQKLGEENIQRLLSPAASAAAASYRVQSGDTLLKIARKSGITVELLRASNGLRGDLIRVGQTLKIPRAEFSVIVDKSQNTLTLKNGEEVVKVYRCSTGAGGITPTGDFRIVSRMVDPIWKGVTPPGDPENPLGTRWLGFDLPEYGIHGTHQPETVGLPVTKGCVRLLNSEVEELYDLLPEGTVVTIVE